MYTIKDNNSYEFEIKKSKFISKIYKVYNLDEVNNILSSLKKEYSDATHHCYSYIINENKKCSDDNEPSGTAGLPILQVLEKNNLNFVLCVVIRYFGGIKLGASGLLQAYTKSVSELIKICNLTELIEGYKIEITCSYDKQKKLDYVLKNYKYEKIYNKNIVYLAYIPINDLDTFKNYSYKIIENLFIEK